MIIQKNYGRKHSAERAARQQLWNKWSAAKAKKVAAEQRRDTRNDSTR